MKSASNVTEWLEGCEVNRSAAEKIITYACPQQNRTKVLLMVEEAFQNLSIAPAENYACDKNIVVDLFSWAQTAVFEYYNLTNHTHFCK